MIPLYPEGTTLASVVRIGMDIGVSQPDLRIYSHIFHGWGIKEIAKRFLAPSDDLRLAIRKHTAAPVLLAIRKESYAAELEDALCKGVQPSIVSRHLLPVDSFVKRCPRCVESDLREIGVACARVLHQVIGVAHCSLHNVPLQKACKRCGNGSKELNLSQGRVTTVLQDLRRCGTCGATEGVSLTVPEANAYRIYVDLLSSAFNGPAWFLRPDVRLHLIETVMERASKDGIDLLSAFAAVWGTKSFESAAALCGASPHSLKSVLNGTGLNTDPATVLMSVSFALSFLEAQNIHFTGEFCELVATVQLSDSDHASLVNKLMRIGRSHGVPRHLVEHLTQNVYTIPPRASGGTFQALLNELTDEELRLLSQSRSNSQVEGPIRYGHEKRRLRHNRFRVMELRRSMLRARSSSKKVSRFELAQNRDLYRWMLTNDAEWFSAHAALLYQHLFVG